VFVILVMLTVC